MPVLRMRKLVSGFGIMSLLSLLAVVTFKGRFDLLIEYDTLASNATGNTILDVDNDSDTFRSYCNNVTGAYLGQFSEEFSSRKKHLLLYFLSVCWGVLFLCFGAAAVGTPTACELVDADFYRKEVIIDVLFGIFKEFDIIGPFFSGYLVYKYCFPIDNGFGFVKKTEIGTSNLAIIADSLFTTCLGRFLFLMYAGQVCCTAVLNVQQVITRTMFQPLDFTWLWYAFVPVKTLVTGCIVLFVAKTKLGEVARADKHRMEEDIEQSSHQYLLKIKDVFPDQFADQDDKPGFSCEDLLCKLSGTPSMICNMLPLLAGSDLHHCGINQTLLLVLIVHSVVETASGMRGFWIFFGTMRKILNQIDTSVDKLLIFKSVAQFYHAQLDAESLQKIIDLRNSVAHDSQSSSESGPDSSMDNADASADLLERDLTRRLQLVDSADLLERDLSRRLQLVDPADLLRRCESGQQHVQIAALRDLDLTDPGDLAVWTQLRRYIKTDLTHQSSFLDIMVTGSLLYAFWFGGVALAASMSPASFGSEVCLVMSIVNCSLFVAVFVKAANTCVMLNYLFQHDVDMLLEVLSKMHENCSPEGKTELAGGQRHEADLAHVDRHMEHLKVLREKLSLHDKPLTLLGIKMTSRLRNAILASGAGPVFSMLRNVFMDFAESSPHEKTS